MLSTAASLRKNPFRLFATSRSSGGRLSSFWNCDFLMRSCRASQNGHSFVIRTQNCHLFCYAVTRRSFVLLFDHKTELFYRSLPASGLLAPSISVWARKSIFVRISDPSQITKMRNWRRGRGSPLTHAICRFRLMHECFGLFVNSNPIWSLNGRIPLKRFPLLSKIITFSMLFCYGACQLVYVLHLNLLYIFSVSGTLERDDGS